MKTHGRSVGDPTYQSWYGMRSRCNNPKDKAYRHYGGRGIQVCARWMQFENFLTDMGERPKGTSIDRKNTNGNYEPDNCRWATVTEQHENKRSNVNLTFNGETRCVSAWAKVVGIKRERIYKRLALGWGPARAVFTPIGEGEASAIINSGAQHGVIAAFSSSLPGVNPTTWLACACGKEITLQTSSWEDAGRLMDLHLREIESALEATKES